MPEENKTNSNETVSSGGEGFWDKLTSDKRLLGAAAAGLAGATAGAFVAPDFIYKKPTWYNRFLLGAGTGVSTAAIVLAAMAAMQKKPETKPSWTKATSNIKDFLGEIPASLGGTKYSKQEVTQMTPGGKAAHGIKGGGAAGWFVRNFLKRPFGDSKGMWGATQGQQTPSFMDRVGAWGKTLSSTALPLFVGQQVKRGLDNAQRAREFVRAAQARNELLSGVASKHIARLQQRLNKGSLGQVGQIGKAVAAGPAQKLANILKKLPQKNQKNIVERLSKNLSGFARGEKLWNPYLQTAGARTTGMFNTALASKSLLGHFNQNAVKFNIRPDGNLAKLITAGRTNRVFRGAKSNKIIGALAALATLGSLGAIHSVNASDPYEQMVRYGE